MENSPDMAAPAGSAIGCYLTQISNYWELDKILYLTSEFASDLEVEVSIPETKQI